jgi:hypothetical protein
VDARNKAAHGWWRAAAAGGNNIKTLLVRRGVAQSYDIVAARVPLRSVHPPLLRMHSFESELPE